MEASRSRRYASFAGRTLVRIGLAILGGFGFLLILQNEIQYNIFDAVFLSTFARLLFSGVMNTLFFMGIVIPTGIVIGFVTGWARVSKYKFLSYPATAYVDVIRGIPLIVLVLFAYFFGPFIVPGLFGFTDVGKFFAALALALHTGAYQAEIFRAGFQSVPKGQLEAAVAVGLTRGQAVGYVVMPQMFRLILPALANELASVAKDTSFLSIIGAMELFGNARSGTQIAIYNFGRLDWVFGLWTITAVLYLLLTLALSKSLQHVERRYLVPGLGSVSA